MQRFIDNGDNTVTDSSTGLIWTKSTVASDVNYKGATEQVEALGDGWRLPTVDELQSIVDRAKYRPAIDSEAFPDTENDCYWTSTPCAWNASARWVVYFDCGHVDDSRQYGVACVRAVRASQ